MMIETVDGRANTGELMSPIKQIVEEGPVPLVDARVIRHPGNGATSQCVVLGEGGCRLSVVPLEWGRFNVVAGCQRTCSGSRSEHRKRDRSWRRIRRAIGTLTPFSYCMGRTHPRTGV